MYWRCGGREDQLSKWCKTRNQFHYQFHLINKYIFFGDMNEQDIKLSFNSLSHNNGGGSIPWSNTWAQSVMKQPPEHFSAYYHQIKSKEIFSTFLCIYIYTHFALGPLKNIKNANVISTVLDSSNCKRLMFADKKRFVNQTVGSSQRDTKDLSRFLYLSRPSWAGGMSVAVCGSGCSICTLNKAPLDVIIPRHIFFFFLG